MSDVEILPGALVRIADQPPSAVPVVVLDELVPFPGPVVPMLLEREERRRAVVHARHHGGYLLLANRKHPRDAGPAAGEPEPHLEPVPEPAPAAESPSPGEDEAGTQGPAGADPATRTDGEPEPRDPVAPEAQATAAASPGGSGEASGDGAGAGEPTIAVAPPPLELADLAPTGVIAKLVRVLPLPDGRVSALVEIVGRARAIELVRTEPFPMARVLYPIEVGHEDEEFHATYRQLRLKLQAFFAAHPHLAEEVKVAAMAIEQPRILADFVGQHLSRDHEERLGFLEELDVGKRLRRALEVAIRELDLLGIGNRISQEIRERVEKHQREYFLREQMKSIRRELGEEKDPASLAIAELTEKLDKAGLPPVARARADEELKRLQLLPSESPEHNVVRSYLDWIASLPWSAVSADDADLAHARSILDADHYGLGDVKERILEFLAVRQLNPAKSGSLLCFAGPPGVGKTSLGKSIARALGREFYRFSVGGMRDEAEIKGHRRTYIGALPGRILQGLKHCGTANPVFMLDELDKMGSDWRGDPSSALLEVLDPAQNNAFADHYLDLPFDLSRVMFIATVNVKTEVPDALRDRLEIIDLAGYIPEEKVEIAARHLLPRQRAEAGLTAQQIAVPRQTLMRVVREYTHEAGVRELERQLGRICRKRASEIVTGKDFAARVGPEQLPVYLGPPKIQQDRLARRLEAGVVLGLAWTPVGGEVLFIEATAMPGKGSLRLTGQLGEVMSESATLALSYVRTHAVELGLDPTLFADRDLHVHFPAGAVKKDGPSAGVTITTALISLLTGRATKPQLAMTGEMTLRGEVLPVGGIREKVVAARRMGVRTVVLPERNRADVEEIPREVREQVEFVFASTYDDVLAAALQERPRPGRGARPKRAGPVANGNGHRSAEERRAGRSPAPPEEARAPRRAGPARLARKG